jgi:hypothetical protein
MNWQDIFTVRSGLTGAWYSKLYQIYYKDSLERVPNTPGYDDVMEAFEAAELLFNRLENELENFLLG